MDLCPQCGETVYIGLGHPNYRYTLNCDVCNTTWTMTELEIYELSFPSETTKRIVKELNKISYALATDKNYRPKDYEVKQ
jgi:hypothetical protein